MSDDLIGRADSLMRRSRTFVAGRVAPAVVDDGIPLLTEEVDLDTLVPEPEDRSAEITAAVTAEVTERVTAEVTERVTAEVTERVTAEVTERVTGEVARAVGIEVRERLQQTTSDALSQQFSDLPAAIQGRIDDWCATTLPALVSIEMQVAFEAALGAALENATARIREQAVLDLRESIAADIENRSQAVLNATVEPSDQPDQPL
ncbi:MAG: hypothetical protein JZU45_09270 [Methyloversatilis discipulorum]|uniref:hypothetical protein n=1 Tax=Methyloversatilis discipulorum TaxID=1119528 RepID=UPI0026EC18A0|nr:hypothetical protein [Methyloversatilis discipulorum]MBV5286255.1 hypothetical protein [Methyloversatilis discipulorum]